MNSLRHVGIAVGTHVRACESPGLFSPNFVEGDITKVVKDGYHINVQVDATDDGDRVGHTVHVPFWIPNDFSERIQIICQFDEQQNLFC